MKKTLEEINEEGTKFVGELLDGEKKGIAPTLDDLRKLTALVDEGAKIAVREVKSIEFKKWVDKDDKTIKVKE